MFDLNNFIILNILLYCKKTFRQNYILQYRIYLNDQLTFIFFTR
jgi:hypothetical protein